MVGARWGWGSPPALRDGCYDAMCDARCDPTNGVSGTRAPCGYPIARDAAPPLPRWHVPSFVFRAEQYQTEQQQPPDDPRSSDNAALRRRWRSVVGVQRSKRGGCCLKCWGCCLAGLVTSSSTARCPPQLSPVCEPRTITRLGVARFDHAQQKAPAHHPDQARVLTPHAPQATACAPSSCGLASAAAAAAIRDLAPECAAHSPASFGPPYPRAHAIHGTQRAMTRPTALRAAACVALLLAAAHAAGAWHAAPMPPCSSRSSRTGHSTCPCELPLLPSSALRNASAEGDALQVLGALLDTMVPGTLPSEGAWRAFRASCAACGCFRVTQ